MICSISGTVLNATLKNSQTDIQHWNRGTSVEPNGATLQNWLAMIFDAVSGKYVWGDTDANVPYRQITQLETSTMQLETNPKNFQKQKSSKRVNRIKQT